MTAKGGISKGKSHHEGGIPLVVKSTGQQVELEGGEGVINKRNMASEEKFEFEGKRLTTCEIASEINQANGNGVAIDCDDIIGKKYKYDKGGNVKKGAYTFEDYQTTNEIIDGKHENNSSMSDADYTPAVTEFRQGGTTKDISVPKANKMFHLPLELAVYVPSTQDVDKVISESELEQRVSEVSKYLASTFGGFTKSDKIGGYLSSKSEVVTEDVVPVTSFATREDFESNKDALINKMSDWAKKWGQEAIGFEFEGDMYYVPQNFKQGGAMYDNGGGVDKGIDLFEDYENIPPKVQAILNKYEESFEDGDYQGLTKANNELNKIGYTFDFYLDGVAYDLRPIGTMGKSQSNEYKGGGAMYDNGGGIDKKDELNSKEQNAIKSIVLNGFYGASGSLIKKQRLEVLQSLIAKGYLDENANYTSKAVEYVRPKYTNGGGVHSRQINRGEAVLYKDKTWYYTERNGEKGIVNYEQGAWGSDNPFIPIQKIDMTKISDMNGDKVHFDLDDATMHKYDAMVNFRTKDTFEQGQISYKDITAFSKEDAEKKARDIFNQESADRFNARVEYVYVYHKGLAYSNGGATYGGGGTLKPEYVESLIPYQTFSVDFYISSDTRNPEMEGEEIEAKSLEKAIEYAKGIAHRNGLNYFEIYQGNLFLGSVNFAKSQDFIEGRGYKDYTGKKFDGGGLVSPTNYEVFWNGEIIPSTIELIDEGEYSEHTEAVFEYKGKAYLLSYNDNDNEVRNPNQKAKIDEYHSRTMRFDIGGKIPHLSERDFVQNKSFEIGNTRIQLEKPSGKYYRVRYYHVADGENAELWGSYGSPNLYDVIQDINQLKFDSVSTTFKQGGDVALQEGTKHELEHSSTINKFKKKGMSTKSVAMEIAKDHLKKDKDYYKKLDMVEHSTLAEIISTHEKNEIKDKNRKRFDRGGNTMYVPHLVHIVLDQPFKTEIFTMEGKHDGDTMFKKNVLYKMEFLNNRGTETALQFPDTLKYVILPNNVFSIKGYDTKFAGGGNVPLPYESYKSDLSDNDIKILNLLRGNRMELNGANHFTIAQKQLLSTFRGTNLANQLSTQIISKMYSLLFKYHNETTPIKRIHIKNVGTGNMLNLAPTYIDEIVVSDEYNMFMEIESQICGITNEATYLETWMNYDQFTQDPADAIIYTYPTINPMVDVLTQTISEMKNNCVALCLAEFTSENHLNNFVTGTKTNGMALNTTYIFDKINEGVSSKGKYTLIYFISKNK